MLHHSIESWKEINLFKMVLTEGGKVAYYKRDPTESGSSLRIANSSRAKILHVTSCTVKNVGSKPVENATEKNRPPQR